MAYFPFRATSNRVQNIAVTDTSAFYAFPNNGSATQPNTLSGNTVLLQNAGAGPVYFAWGDTTVTAVNPTWDGTDGTHVLLPGVVMVLSIPQSYNFPTGVRGIAFICATADSGTHVSFALGEGE